METIKRGRRKIGTVVERKNHYIFVKVDHNTWQSHHRWVMEKMTGKALTPSDRVYHRNGDRRDNDPANLVIIRRRIIQYELLESSRVLFEPKTNRPAEALVSVPINVAAL